MSIRVTVTGGKGYIGTALVEFLKGLDFIEEVYVYDLIDGNDINDYNQVSTFMREYVPDIVIHLAAVSSITECNEDISKAVLTNGKGTYNLLKAMKSVGCRKIIYASTSAVYSPQAYLPYCEQSKICPSSAYGFAKLLGEHAIFSADVDHLIFRMFNVVGTSGRSNIDKNLSKGYDKLFAALESGNLTIYGNDYNTYDGTGVRDYISLKDTCEAYIKGLLLLINSDYLREVVNISSGVGFSVLDLVQKWNAIKIRNFMDHRFPIVNYTFGPRRLGDMESTYGDNTKASTLMRWKPVHTISDTISEVFIDKSD